jgi:hypothetical protein
MTAQAALLEIQEAPREIVMDHAALLEIKRKIAILEAATEAVYTRHLEAAKAEALETEEQLERLKQKLADGVAACVEAGILESGAGKIVETPGRASIRKFTPEGIDKFREAYPELYVKYEKVTLSVSDVAKAIGDEGIKPFVEGGERGASTFEILSPLELQALEAMKAGKEKRSGRSKA